MVCGGTRTSHADVSGDDRALWVMTGIAGVEVQYRNRTRIGTRSPLRTLRMTNSMIRGELLTESM